MIGFHKHLMYRLQGVADLSRSMYNGDKGGDAPDYGPLLAASDKQIALGEKQLGFSKQQYGTNMGILAPLVDQQLAAGKIQTSAGVDYLNEQNATARPVRMGLYREFMGDESPISYREAPTPQTYSYDPNAKGPAQIAVDKYNSGQNAASYQSQIDSLMTQRNALTQGYTNGLSATGGASTFNPGTDGYWPQQTGLSPEAIKAQTDSYNASLKNIDDQIAALRGQSTAATSATGLSKTAPYKLAGNQIIGDKFFSGGNGYTVRTDERTGMTLLINKAGQEVGSIDQNGRVLSSKNPGVVNAFLNSQQNKDAVGGAIGKYDNNKYFANGQAYYVDQKDDGTYALVNSAGKEVAGYKLNKQGAPIFTGNSKLMQQAMSDKSYYDTQAKTQAESDAALQAKKDAITKAGGDPALMDRYQYNEDGTLAMGADNKPIIAKTAETAEMKTYDWKAQADKGMDAASGRAKAAIETELASNRDATMRQLRGMGMNMSSPAALAALASFTKNSGLAQANAMNKARDDAKRERFAQGMSLAGLGGALPGYSTAAFGGATNSGQGATQALMAPGNQYNQGAAVGFNAMGAGLSGLGNAYGMQTSAYNASANQPSMLGTVAGMGLSAMMGPQKPWFFPK